MRNNQDGTALDVFPHPLEDLNQILETPQVNSRLGLIKHGQLCRSGQNRGNFNALQFAAGKTAVHLTVNILSGTQTHLGEVIACTGYGKLFSGSQTNQIKYLNSLETNGLLKGKSDSGTGTRGDIPSGDILPVQENLSGGRHFNSGNQLCQGGFSSAIRPGNNHQFLIRHHQTDITDDFLVHIILCIVGDIFKFQHSTHPSLVPIRLFCLRTMSL